MSATKSKIDAASKSNGQKLDENARREQAELLLNEIDNLAILLHEVKRQTDRIEAAADAIGDAVLSHLDGARIQELDSRNLKKNALILQMKSGSRLRTLLSRSPDVQDA